MRLGTPRTLSGQCKAREDEITQTVSFHHREQPSGPAVVRPGVIGSCNACFLAAPLVATMLEASHHCLPRIGTITLMRFSLENGLQESLKELSGH